MRVQLSRRADYAVRAVLGLVSVTEATAAEIAEAEGIPASSLPHILAALARSGVVESAAGRGGGYRLALAPGAITLKQVLEAVDGPQGELRCLLDHLPCRAEVACEVHEQWARALREMTKTLEETTLAGLLECPRRSAVSRLSRNGWPRSFRASS